MRKQATRFGVVVWLLAACTGEIGNGVSNAGKPGVGESESDAGMAAGEGGATGVDSGQPAIPYSPVSSFVYVRKVKTVLTGLAPTAAEQAAVASDPTALKGLIDTWIATPQATVKLLSFFGDAFQQSQFLDNPGLLGLVGWAMHNQALTHNALHGNIAESFPRTALYMMQNGIPFNQTMNTQTFMMTPALLMNYLMADAARDVDTDMDLQSPQDTDEYHVANPNWAISFVDGTAGPNIPFSESIDPTSPNYLHFAVQGSPDQCGVNPFNIAAAYSTGTLFTYLWQGATPPVRTGCDGNLLPIAGDGRRLQCAVAPGHDAPAEVTIGAVYRLLRSAHDSNPRAKSSCARRGSVSSSRHLAFFATWLTNASNDARVTTNQALIVALGQSFNPSTTVTPLTTTGIDGMHADPTSVCYGCHKSLDPMREYFRRSYTLEDQRQVDPTLTSLAGSFAFGGVTTSGPTLKDFANTLASHPLFAPAWVQKVCYFANSAPCDETDPEFLRVTQAFQNDNFDFNTLLRELLSSPLVTGATPTQTWVSQGETVSISRYNHFCGALSNRLNIPDACALAPNVATSLPFDTFSRGDEDPLLASEPSLFYRAAVESLCISVANATFYFPNPATGSPGGIYRGMAPNDVISDLVSNVMGLTATDPAAAPSQQVLTHHYNAALATGVSQQDALKSTITLACTSAASASLSL